MSNEGHGRRHGRIKSYRVTLVHRRSFGGRAIFFRVCVSEIQAEEMEAFSTHSDHSQFSEPSAANVLMNQTIRLALRHALDALFV